MSDPTHIDKDMNHIYLDFRVLLQATLQQANHECHDPATGKPKFPDFVEWIVFEGYRSQERQSYLYAQGRSRTGNIVTNAKVPGWHGFGLACDVVWKDRLGHLHWDGDAGLWDILGHCARANGLEWGGDWKGNLGDKGHIQIPKSVVSSYKPKARQYLKGLGLSTP